MGGILPSVPKHLGKNPRLCLHILTYNGSSRSIGNVGSLDLPQFRRIRAAREFEFIKEELGPALTRYIEPNSVRVTAIAQPEGSVVEATLSTVNATYTDLKAGFTC